MSEFWKDIEEYEGLYQVSNLGRVKSLNRKTSDGRRLKERIRKLGLGSVYLTVNLCKDGVCKTFHVHNIVSAAFLNYKPSSRKIVIDHIDNNKLNNRVDNLEIITQRKNVTKSINRGTSNFIGVSKNKANNKWSANIYVNGKCKFLGYFDKEIEASKAYQYEIKKLNTYNHYE